MITTMATSHSIAQFILQDLAAGVEVNADIQARL